MNRWAGRAARFDFGAEGGEAAGGAGFFFDEASLSARAFEGEELEVVLPPAVGGSFIGRAMAEHNGRQRKNNGRESSFFMGMSGLGGGRGLARCQFSNACAAGRAHAEPTASQRLEILGHRSGVGVVSVSGI